MSNIKIAPKQTKPSKIAKVAKYLKSKVRRINIIIYYNTEMCIPAQKRTREYSKMPKIIPTSNNTILILQNHSSMEICCICIWFIWVNFLTESVINFYMKRINLRLSILEYLWGHFSAWTNTRLFLTCKIRQLFIWLPTNSFIIFRSFHFD